MQSAQYSGIIALAANLSRPQASWTNGMTLAIAAGITLGGWSSEFHGGSIGYSGWHGRTTYALVNQGTISADVAGTSLKL